MDYKMDYGMFQRELQELAEEGLKDKGDYTLSIYTAHKNNITKTGLMVSEKGKTISPTVYLSDFYPNPKPFPSYLLTNNSAEIRRLKSRIEELKQCAEVGFCGWEFDGGKAVANQEAGRLQLLFEEKPSPEHRAQLKANGFRWAPKAGAWQRMLNKQAIYAAGRMDFIRPLSGQAPQELQPNAGKKSEKQKSMQR